MTEQPHQAIYRRDAARRFALVSRGPALTSERDQLAAKLMAIGTPAAANDFAHQYQREDAARNGSGASSGAAATAAVSGGDEEGGGVMAGLMDWALWPLWGTVDAIKWAGSSVTEVAVAPVLRYAGPEAIAETLWTRFVEWTPQRARDIGRIFRNGAANVAKISRTREGAEVLRSASAATRSLAMAVSSPAGRQFVIDSATGLAKVAEAMDTPEVKNVLQQSAVVLARAMDAMATRHSKIFLQDAANTAALLLELAKSSETMDMAAEFTADVCHALQMEHTSGERDDPRFAVDHPATMPSPDRGVDDSYSFALEQVRAALASGTPRGEVTPTAAAAVSAVGDVGAGTHRPLSDSTTQGSVWSGNTDRMSRQARMTQANLYRDGGLRTSGPEFAATVTSSTLSPRSRPAPASPPPSAPGTRMSDNGVGVGAPAKGAGGGRPRSNSDGMVEDRMDGGPGARVFRRNTAGRENEVHVAGAGDVSTDYPDSTGAPAGYPRDTSHSMPRFLPITRGSPVELEIQPASPTLRTVERSVHDAARRYRKVVGDDPLPARKRSGAGVADGVASDDVADHSGARPGAGRGRSNVDGNDASPRPAGSWLQKVVVVIVFLFAFDGLRHELFGNRRATPLRTKSASRSSFPARAAGSNGVSMRPTCHDPETGTAMRIWATPRGACLSLEGEGSEDEEVWKGASPTCGAEFRLCAAREITRVTRKGVSEGITVKPARGRRKESPSHYEMWSILWDPVM